MREHWARTRKTAARLRTAAFRGRDGIKQVLVERQRVRELRQRVRELKAEVDGLRAKTALFGPLDDLAREGGSFEKHVVRMVREGHKSGDRVLTRGFVHALMDDPEQSHLGHLCLGVFLVQDEIFDAAATCFDIAGRDSAQELCPREYFLARGATAGADVEAELQQFLDEHRSGRLDPGEHLALLDVASRHLWVDLVARESERLVADESFVASLDQDQRRHLDWLRLRTQAWGQPAEELAEGVVSLAVMDYKLLDRSRTSSNRGDYVQTLAALANICRFSDVEFVGDDDLAGLLRELQGRIRDDRRVGGVQARVRAIPLDRDFSSGRSYPDNTWLLCNGWFMHRNFRGHIDFPFPDTVNPIFLSFHVQDPDVLTDAQVIENLRKYEPIGCRDWTTVYRLADYGVKAFFSGCVTTTVGQVFPGDVATRRGRVALVEAKTSPGELSGKEVASVIQFDDSVRDFTLVEGVRDAQQMLESYRTAEKVITSRLHCYLPSRSLGLEVDFRPRNLADVRFEGLIDLGPAEFSAIRTGLEDRLEQVFRAIFSGQSRDDVMALWRELCADDVAAADRYRSTYPDPPASSIDLDTVIPEMLREVVVRESTPPGPHSMQLAFAIDQNLKQQLAVVLQSIVDHCDGGFDVHLMGRGLDETYLDQLHRLIPQATFRLYDFDKVDYGDRLRMLKHITVSTMDRLLLPELLDGVDRVLYLDADILVRADVRELYDRDLGGAVLAGKRSNLPTWRNMVRLITRASLSLSYRDAWSMRRRLHHTHHLGAPTFNAGVLLLDLATMRREQFTARYLHLVEHAAFNDQDVLNVYAGERAAELEPGWNHVPSQDVSDDIRIIHWAGPSKPWKQPYVWGRPLYDEVRDRVAAKVPDLFGPA